MTAPLDKAVLLAGHQCLRRAWIEVHRPDGADLHPLARAARRRESDRVEALAARRFPGAVHVDPDDPIPHTRALLARRVPAIVGGVVDAGGLRTRLDVLARRPDGWRLVDVRSGLRIREGHVVDLALQVAIARRAGVRITEAGVLSLRRGYRRGAGIDVQRLFVARDLTARLRAAPLDLDALSPALRAALGGAVEPDLAPGPQCTTPWRCPFADRCGAPFARPVARPPPEARAAVAAGVPWFSADLHLHLDTPRPWHFLDFEAYSPAVPAAPGLRPYQALPFLWALVTDAPAGTTEAARQIADADPRRAFATTLLDAVPGEGPIVVWSPYEARMLGSLAEDLPDLADGLLALQDRVVDLLAVVRRRVWHPGFGGSYSLKAVAPALADDAVWSGLPVRDGREAALLALGLHNGTIQGPAAPPLRAQLQAYCAADARAVRAVWLALRRRVMGRR